MHALCVGLAMLSIAADDEHRSRFCFLPPALRHVLACGHAPGPRAGSVLGRICQSECLRSVQFSAAGAHAPCRSAVRRRVANNVHML
jgi:hypothetical protein